MSSMLLLLGILATSSAAAATEGDRPNVVIIMTDDQGFGDLGIQGHPVLKTPRIDALSAESATVGAFYVHPVCTPTRAALFTGRHPQRTTAIDTWIGRAMLEPDEITIAERLRDAGYATGIFGKWHLGDCHPMRPMDQGFDVSVVHRGGGIAQPADPEGGEGRYTDPILLRNGVLESFEGWCTDVYVDEMTAWMAKQDTPFFAVLRVVKVLPQVHVTAVSTYSGWISAFTSSRPLCRCPGRRPPSGGEATGTGARKVCHGRGHSSSVDPWTAGVVFWT